MTEWSIIWLQSKSETLVILIMFCVLDWTNSLSYNWWLSEWRQRHKEEFYFSEVFTYACGLCIKHTHICTHIFSHTHSHNRVPRSFSAPFEWKPTQPSVLSGERHEQHMRWVIWLWIHTISIKSLSILHPHGSSWSTCAGLTSCTMGGIMMPNMGAGTTDGHVFINSMHTNLHLYAQAHIYKQRHRIKTKVQSSTGSENSQRYKSYQHKPVNITLWMFIMLPEKCWSSFTITSLVICYVLSSYSLSYYSNLRFLNNVFMLARQLGSLKSVSSQQRLPICTVFLFIITKSH